MNEYSAPKMEEGRSLRPPVAGAGKSPSKKKLSLADSFKLQAQKTGNVDLSSKNISDMHVISIC